MNPVAEPRFILLYVESPAASTVFYEKLLGRGPVESSPTFAMFALGAGVMLGLWSRHSVKPPAAAAGGGGELGFPVANDATVKALHAEWFERGLPILQEPVAMDFGFTFVATDPDGHRLRVFHPSAA